jgi:hypothetical protein
MSIGLFCGLLLCFIVECPTSVPWIQFEGKRVLAKTIILDLKGSAATAEACETETLNLANIPLSSLPITVILIARGAHNQDKQRLHWLRKSYDNHFDTL